MILTAEQREKERELFESERRKYPQLFERAPMIDSAEFLSWIGINNVFGNYPIGYVKFFPQDFIVEEISPAEQIFTVDDGELFANTQGEGSTHYAELVKMGISTLEIKDQLAKALAVEANQISWAGIKDRFALTSQRISIRGICDPGLFESTQFENMFLKNIVRGKGVVDNGALRGNQFILTIRLVNDLSLAEKTRVEEAIKDVQENGFWNFFSFQRFGTPRLISHLMGRHLVKREHEDAIKLFLTFQGSRELPYFQNIRKEIELMWPNWQAIQEKLSRLPSHFMHELSLIAYLADNPLDFLGALKTIPDQVRLWVYAYDSYLFNRKLSQCIAEKEAPLKLPFISSFEPQDWEPYREYLKEDGVVLPSRVYKDFSFIQFASREVKTLQEVKISKMAFLDKLVVMAFSLPKGAYATTFLAHFFQVASGLPMVPGIEIKEIDAKEALGLGSLKPALARFSSVLAQIKNDREAIPD